jgi:hypothetical protein
MRGDWFDVCSCNIACPCEFAQPPTNSWVRRTNLHLTLRFLGDAVDPKRLAALGKNLSETLPRRPLSSAIRHFLCQDLLGNSHARNARASIQ